MLDIQGLFKSFGSFRALQDVSVRVENGEFFALLGPSGCGKTTLLRMIAGLEFPDRGQIQIDGKRVDHLPANVRPCHTVFQSYALFPHMTVGENVAFPLRLKGVSSGEAAKRASRALEMVQLGGLDQRQIGSLSGGQQQRVALARALVGEPPIILLDEPLSALDFKLRQTMREELKRLQRRVGCIFIFVTHDQDEALSMADRIAVMNLGKIEQCGTGIEIYDKPLTPFVADFIGRTNRLEGENQRGGGGLMRLIRPERMRLSGPSGNASSNEANLAGRIDQIQYRGSVIDYIVDPGDRRPTVVVSLPASGPDFKPWKAGENVKVLWDRNDEIALSAH